MEIRKVGIVGVGPRGGYALERLILELAKQRSLTNIHISLFEATGYFGNGHVYNLNQNPANWINITERVLDIKGRKSIEIDNLKIPSFPSYHEWLQKDEASFMKEIKDSYPPRIKMGEFLTQRFQSLVQPLILKGIVSLHVEEVLDVKLLNSNKIQIVSNKEVYDDFEEVLLTIGHQKTKLSDQIKEWDNYAKNLAGVNLYKYPYPLSDFLTHKSFNKDVKIGIRGFGLAFVDVMRAIAKEFGEFIVENEKTQLITYKTKHSIEGMLVPFSLDGLPLVPKPINGQVDKIFQPTSSDLEEFENRIGDKQIQKAAESPRFLLTAFADTASKIYFELSNSNKPQEISKTEVEKLIVNWLRDQSFEHATITSKIQSAEKSMRDFVGMATGEEEISLDFCIGQVWRHFQPSIYKKLSYNECSDDVFEEIIALDESTKRYSYGPPVESIQQIIALVEAKVLNLNLVTDPNIELTQNGWELSNSKKSSIVTMMIDCVLDAPRIKSVKTSVVNNLLSDGIIKAVHDKLGVATDENGYLIPENKDRSIPIALLGRLAKGTVIGVDAILECLGDRPRKWAEKAAGNHVKWVENNEKFEK
ncbi:FAD/NAD(P)-binding protein [Brumimicrobium mesophilum]|uniref:FAD/NAD(P)-binding protein n=1 Tax=Brumimicrobium mesophilum TaxID=392717 RepID=UPI000D144894|nr:FAD/NAD(P)-binding protein [Brumimicrobium mesophilum]